MTCAPEKHKKPFKRFQLGFAQLAYPNTHLNQGEKKLSLGQKSFKAALLLH